MIAKRVKILKQFSTEIAFEVAAGGRLVVSHFIKMMSRGDVLIKRLFVIEARLAILAALQAISS